MEMGERIKELRKKHLHLSQTDFGERLGVSRSVINNIERNALARPDQKLSLIKLICKEFNVNEDWILNGNEPMFIEPDSFSLDRFVEQHGATDLELRIVKTYFELDPDIRSMLVEHFRKGFIASVEKRKAMDQYDSAPKTPEELERLYPPINNYDNNSKTG